MVLPFCARLLAYNPIFPAYHTLPRTICQHDIDAEQLFQHRNERKWSMCENPQTPGFQFEAECVRLVDKLKCAWSPAAQPRVIPDEPPRNQES